MLKQFRLFSLIICTLVASSTTAQAPFSRGVNITGWFQASGPRQIQFSQYSKKILKILKVWDVMPSDSLSICFT